MSHLVVFTLASLLLAPGALPAGGQTKEPKKQSQNNRESATLKGCVDEQNGQYVLLDDRTMSPIADLDANGIPPESLFAKHLGHKVTVRGSSTPGATRPTFKVRDIQTISEMCAPQTPQ